MRFPLYFVLASVSVAIIASCRTVVADPQSCTTVMLAKDDHVVLGDNEDAGTWHPLSRDPFTATVRIFPRGLS